MREQNDSRRKKKSTPNLASSDSLEDLKTNAGGSLDSFDEEGNLSSISLDHLDGVKETVKVVLPAPVDLDMERLQNPSERSDELWSRPFTREGGWVPT